jgi:hypothetical protein
MFTEVAVRAACAVTALMTALLGSGAAAAAAPTPEIDAARLEASYNAGATFVRHPALDGRLAELVARLVASNPDAGAVASRIHALREPLPYAFALDNGALYISTGLIARLSDETQLAGLIAAELAALVRHDSLSSRQSLRERGLAHFVPNLLLITATAGLAAVAINKGDIAARERVRRQLQSESDALALRWLARAGYDPHEVPRGLQRLLDALTQEQRFGASELANADLLNARIESFNRGMPPVAADASPAAAAPAAEWWRPLARRFALDIAYTDLNRGDAVALHGMLAEVDADDGPTSMTAFLRAEDLRKRATEPDRIREVIAAYQSCVAFADAPPLAYRELGFLYRRQGDVERARSSFQDYLSRAPTAADAPIIRGYMEAL